MLRNGPTQPRGSGLPVEKLFELFLWVADLHRGSARQAHVPARRCVSRGRPGPPANGPTQEPRLHQIECYHGAFLVVGEHPIDIALLTPAWSRSCWPIRRLPRIRRASSALDLSSALGRPMDCPRARRASRAAARRSRPMLGARESVDDPRYVWRPLRRGPGRSPPSRVKLIDRD
jgi:hypothetical protein